MTVTIGCLGGHGDDRLFVDTPAARNVEKVIAQATPARGCDGVVRPVHEDAEGGSWPGVRGRSPGSGPRALSGPGAPPSSTPARGTSTATPICAVTGGAGNGTLTGRAGDDVVCGQGGDGLLRGQGGDDLVIGGLGIDAANYSGASTGVDKGVVGTIRCPRCRRHQSTTLVRHQDRRYSAAFTCVMK